MNEGSIFDIIILIGFLFFIITRFTGNKLPRDDQKDKQKPGQNKGPFGRQATRPQDGPKVVDLPRKPMTPPKPKVSPEMLAKLNGADLLRAVDPGFNEKEFVSGARQAFTLYWQAITDRDEETLDALTSPRLFDQAMEQIEELAEDEKVLLTRIDKIVAVELADTRVSGRTAIAEVKYTADMAQAEVKKSTKTTTAAAKTYEAVWVWARNIDDPDPNWELEDIKPLN